MDDFSICEKCGAAYIHHAHLASSRRDPVGVKRYACPLKRGGFSKTSEFQSFPRCGIPDCVPNGGIEIGDGYYRG